MENKDLTSEIAEPEPTASCEKANEPTETDKVVEEEPNIIIPEPDAAEPEPEASEASEIKPTQNGETELESTETPETTEETEKTTKPVEESEPEPIDKPGRATRGTKRKANDVEKNDTSTESTESETVEQKENVDSKNDDNMLRDSQSNDILEDASMKLIPESLPHIMGKGKRARIPNKRYSDILLSPNRKSMGNSKSGSMGDSVDEITIKEEPLDLPVSIPAPVSTVSSPSLPSTKKARATAPKDNMQDPKYLKPFKFGWKRELVWRSTSTASKPAGDIYYYTPTGKKVRSFREVSEHVTKNLLLDNFSFTKEPLGIDDPEKEIIRDAKIKSSDSFSDSPAPKKVVEVKKPKKVLSPKISRADSPKVDLTPAKRRVEPPPPKETPPSVSRRNATPKETPPSVSKKVPLKMSLRKSKGTPAGKKTRQATKAEEPPAKVAKVVSTPPPTTRSSPNKVTSKPCQPCSIRCEGLQGVVPTLQCRLCLCLYHHECVGLSPSLTFPYVCKNCHEQGQATNPSSSTIVAPPPLTPINSLKSVSTPHSTTLPKLQRIPRPDSADPVPVLQPLQSLPPLVEVSQVNTQQQQQQESGAPARNEMPKLTPKPAQLLQDSTLPNEVSKSLVGSVTSWLPHNVKIVNSEEPTEAPRPQYVEYLAGRKFLVIPKHNFMSVSSTGSALRSEDSFGGTPATLQPTEVPMASASLDPSSEGNEDAMKTENVPQEPENLPQQPDNLPQEPENPHQEPDNVPQEPEIKTEPLSPSKAEEKRPAISMEVDVVVPGSSEGAASSSQIEDHDTEAVEDEASQNSVGTTKLKKRNLKLKSITNNASSSTPEEKNEAKFMENYLQNLSFGYNTLLYVFQYLKVQDLLRAGCVCTMWRDIASHPLLWRTVRMKNSQVHSFEGLANTLKKHDTMHLDLRKMLLPSNGDEIWPEFSEAIARVTTLKKIELCRCPASVVEQLATSNSTLEIINAVTIKCESINLDTLQSLTKIKELRLKSTSGLNINSIDSLKELKTLKILSLTSVNDLHKLNLSVIAELTSLESLDLGECTDFPKNFGQDILSKLGKLEKLRLEKGQATCHTFEMLQAVKDMKRLEQLELVNFDVKAGFDKALGACTNIRKLMIIPTYISQSATTNNMVLAGVLRLQGSLTHFVWGVTLELLRVTELFVDQCEDSNKKEKRPTGNGDSIPVLKPVPDLTHGGDIQAASNPPQVEILPLPNLQKLLLNSLPTTRVKILKIPFHATWRQTLTDSV